MTDRRFIGDEIQLSILDGARRDLSTGYTLEIVVVGPDNVERERIAATAGGTGNSTITASALTAATTFDVEGVFTYHATLTSSATGNPVHNVGVGQVEILPVPGV